MRFIGHEGCDDYQTHVFVIGDSQSVRLEAQFTPDDAFIFEQEKERGREGNKGGQEKRRGEVIYAFCAFF